MARESDVAEQYRDERDAVNTALEIAGGMDRRQALSGFNMPIEPDHFSLGRIVPVDEDSAVADDIRLFPGWDRGRSFALRELSMRIGRRAATHGTTGEQDTNRDEYRCVDLLYHIHDYDSFVLVQYKRVRYQGMRRAVRLDDQLDVELERMQMFENALAKADRPIEALQDYRMSSDTCFFKLIESDQPGACQSTG